MRKGNPSIFTNLKTGMGLDAVVRWIKEDVLFLDQG
jgi:Ni2+-binding GTPase involved in maturation of urease and hydrogenase